MSVPKSCPIRTLELFQHADISRIAQEASLLPPELPVILAHHVEQDLSELIAKYNTTAANPVEALNTGIASCIARMALVHAVVAQVDTAHASIHLSRKPTNTGMQIFHGWNAFADSKKVWGAILDNRRDRRTGGGVFDVYPISIGLKERTRGQSLDTFLVNQLWNHGGQADWSDSVQVMRDENTKYVLDDDGPTEILSFAGADALEVIEELCMGTPEISLGRLPRDTPVQAGSPLL